MDNKVQFSFTLEVLPQVLFPGHTGDVKISSVNVDYSRNIITFYVDGVPQAPDRPEAQECVEIYYDNEAKEFVFPATYHVNPDTGKFEPAYSIKLRNARLASSQPELEYGDINETI
jgi:hypothetical protein